MLELIIDSPDREADAFDALLSAGISAEVGCCVNTIRVPERDRIVAERCMDANGIEWQWIRTKDNEIVVL